MTDSSNIASAAGLAETVHAMNGRLAAAMGEEVPRWSPEVREQAERAVRGEVYRSLAGRWNGVDVDRVDWDGLASDNPEEMAMIMRRFYMLRPLLSGYRATGEERYAQAARRYVEAFLRDHPVGDDWAPGPRDGDTQYDIRVGYWLVALGEFRLSPAFDAAIIGRMIHAVRANLRYLSGHVRPNRNIRILHGQTLLLSGLRLAALPEAAGWMAQGRDILNDAIRRQILPDGAHMESTPGYHEGMLKRIETLWGLARAMPETGLHVPTARVAGMFDYMLAAMRPDGVVSALHDSRYKPAPDLELPIPEARSAFRRKAGLPDTLPHPCASFPDAGQAFLRDDWTPDSCYLTFDAASSRSYHWHPCRNSVTLFAHRRPLLVDPGYTFETERFPRYGHRTAHHNTVNFNGWNQCANPAEFRMKAAGGYALAEGLYGGGYWPQEAQSHGDGIFGQHYRALLWIRNRFGVVIDHIHHTCGEGRKPAVESCWQFAEGAVACDPNAGRVFTRHPQGNLLLAFPLALPGSKLTVHVGEREPMRGWLPVEWGRACVPAPLVRMTAEALDPWHGDMATLLIPYAGAEPPALATAGSAPDSAADTRRAGHVRLDAADGTSDLLAWTRRLAHAIEGQHGVRTDASLVHLRFDAAGAVTGGLLVDGTACEFDGLDVTGRLTVMDRLAIGGAAGTGR